VIEVRDKVAGLQRWKWYPEAGVWQHDDASEGQVDHPIPDTLDACAAAWDRHAGKFGYEWEKRRGTITGALKYRAYKHEDDQPLSVLCSGHDAASELRDRWALLGEVMKARGL